ncbi:hypothetical protein [Lysinibacillus pakistanensis]|uniref:Ead/Ea22-like family protein n=1 Tax=Lysinibacillus pakistanensis TaxID=759811 RepID=A0AAX3WTL9_9BACI|nr:hypothetical protein [Lysinibacillus pakistanensis]MDM5229675.1 hypothetical protein [Lysinibacillus pakistanensis]WHY45285.1 hypothetical protein QNH22_18480 [Lysinibacillus pakistanensis]WHY50293.1 hypothetical protein QNH24_18445 [Lysinibacillus pakistanensis]
MNQEQLNAIKQRVEKATIGPWCVNEEIDGIYDGCRTVVKAPNAPSKWATRIVSVGQTRRHIRKDAESNIEFIAHAREDVPALVAEVERLREALGFYANADNYEPVTIEKWIPQVGGSRKMIQSIVPQSEYVVEDGGEIARQALDGDSDGQWKQNHHT